MDNTPLTFEPVFVPRVWGGRKLETLYRKQLPADGNIGESWEIVDRPETQSMVRTGKWHGLSLHDLWINHRRAVFGDVPDSPRFPILLKLLDCRERLSLQVHPPLHLTSTLGGEAKTEAWFVADADEGSDVLLGLAAGTDRAKFTQDLAEGTVTASIEKFETKRGDVYSVPSGRVHAIGGGNLIMEVQQNSDTTYRVFDWNRLDEQGRGRSLHLEKALPCINFSDAAPRRMNTENETLLGNEFFVVTKVDLRAAKELSPRGKFAIGFCAQGTVRVGAASFTPGSFFLLPADAKERIVAGISPDAELLRITLPS